MSLINQVLKDLDARAAKPPVAGVAPGLRPPPRHSQRWLYLVAVLAVLAGAGVWRFTGWPQADVLPHPSSVAAPAPVPQGVPIAPPTPAPPGGVAADLSNPVTAETRAAPITAATPPAARPTPPPPSDPRPLVSSRGLDGGGSVSASSPAGGGVARQAIERLDGGEQAVIRKQARPLTPEQEAIGHYQEALVLLRRGSRKEAETELTAALEREPSHRAAREALVGTLLAQGRRVEALPLLEQGLLLDPGHGLLAQLAAQLHLENGDPAQAVARLEAAVEVNPDLELVAALAATLQSARRYGESAALYRRLVEVRPEQGSYWAGLGIALDRSGEAEAARAAYRRARAAGGLKPALGGYVSRRLEELGG